MCTPITTNTIQPLHFIDLGWERFEDLVSDIVFNQRKWDKIYHFGKMGNDFGKDIEAEYITENSKETWVFQCKRYEKIQKTHLKKIAEDFVKMNDKMPEVYVLVTDCNISKKNIEYFEDYASNIGLSKVLVWTSSYLENMLFNKHPNMLFAFFGIDISNKRNRLIDSTIRGIKIKKRLVDELCFSKATEYRQDLEYPRNKFRDSNLLIRPIDDTYYPSFDDDGYFTAQKVVPYDFYYNGIIVLENALHGVLFDEKTNR